MWWTMSLLETGRGTQDGGREGGREEDKDKYKLTIGEAKAGA